MLVVPGVDKAGGAGPVGGVLAVTDGCRMAPLTGGCNMTLGGREPTGGGGGGCGA